MRHDIAAQLDNCIDALRRGQTREESLAMYPDAAAELAPLLETAAGLRAAPKIQASERALRAGKNVFLAEAARLRQEKRRPSSKPWQRLSFVASTTFAWPRPRALAWTPAVSAVIIVFILILCSGTTAIAASRSLPDEPLYGIKLAAEHVQLAFTSDPLARADLTLSIAAKRVDEVSSLTAAGRSVDAPAIQRLAAGSKAALTTLGHVNEGDIRPLLYRYLSIVADEQAALTKVNPAPADADALAAAIATAQQNEQLAQNAVNDPGVLKDDPQRTGRAPVAVVKETPTPQPTPDARHMRTPAPSPTATSEPVQPAQPSATNTKPPAPTNTATSVPSSPTVPPVATGTATAPLIQFSGLIDKIGASEWTIGGKSVAVDGETNIDGATPRLGARADVVAIAGGNLGLRARSIHVQPLIEIPAKQFTVCGIIYSFSSASWNIAGQTVMIDGGTLINGVPAVGSVAEATGSRKGDMFSATSIIVKGPAPETQVQGRIQSLSGQMWTIGGQNLAIVQGFTIIKGTGTVGASASATAVRQENGSLIAKLIVVSKDGTGSPTAVASPTMPVSPLLTPVVSPTAVGTRTAVPATPSPVKTILAPTQTVVSPTPSPTQQRPQVSPSPTPTNVKSRPTASPTPVKIKKSVH